MSGLHVKRKPRVLPAALAVLTASAGLAWSISGAAAESSSGGMAVQATYTAEADVLNRLQLFQGTEKGYELERAFTRAEGTVMLLRLLGLEKAALIDDVRSPFGDADKPYWASAYVGYARAKGLVHGTSDTSFSPEDPMTGGQFEALVLRALGYAEAEPENAGDLAAASSLAGKEEALALAAKSPFRRDDMVHVAYRALTAKVKGSGTTLLAKLVELDHAVSADAAAATGLYKAQGQQQEMTAEDAIEQALKDALTDK